MYNNNYNVGSQQRDRHNRMPARPAPAQQRITAQQAAEIAVARVSGQIIHVDLDMDQHIVKYEVYILTDQGVVYEVEIASLDGRILSVEMED